MRIGEVHRLLRTDFPDIELSTIRYYEDQGLVKPARTKSGYRSYNDRDVNCLREAFRMAQHEQLRLSQIRLRLIDRGLLDDDGRRVAPVTTRTAARTAVAPVVSLDAPVALPRLTPVRSSVAATSPTWVGGLVELAQAAGLTLTDCQAVLDTGLVRSSLAGDGRYDATDVVVARHVASLLAKGADPRIVAATRRVVEREVGVINDLAATMDATADRNDLAGEWLALRDALFARATNTPSY